MIHKKIIVYVLGALSLYSCSSQSKPVGEKYYADSLIKAGQIALVHVSSFSNRTGEVSSAEVIAFDGKSKRLFIANSAANKLDIIDLSDPLKLKFYKSIDLNKFGRSINSVAVQKNLVAVVIENIERQKNGLLCFFDTDGNYIKSLVTGSIPDMVTFSPNGKTLLVANEGEPNEEYSDDPEGSISIIDISKGINITNQSDVVNLNFRNYNDSINQLKEKGIRIFGPNASVSQDLEPEYIAVSDDSKKAWVTLQENNAIASIDLNEKKISELHPLGEKAMAMKADGTGNTCNLNETSSETYPLKGMYQPDGIGFFKIKDKSYLIMANEGDIRKYQGLKENLKLGNKRYTLDTLKFPNASEMKSKDLLGRLNVTRFEGDLDKDGDFDEIHTFGGRSFSIFESSKFRRIYDSENHFEEITCLHPHFSLLNERHSKIIENKFDSRGPEPEHVVTGKVDNKLYAFITLERYGGIMVYNISDPVNPVFVQYVNINSDNSKSRPEGIVFISEKDSPTRKNLVIVANEGISTVDVYEIKK